MAIIRSGFGACKQTPRRGCLHLTSVWRAGVSGFVRTGRSPACRAVRGAGRAASRSAVVLPRPPLVAGDTVAGRTTERPARHPARPLTPLIARAPFGVQ